MEFGFQNSTIEISGFGNLLFGWFWIPSIELVDPCNPKPNFYSSSSAGGLPPEVLRRRSYSPHSAACRPSAAPEPVKRKRGRPRKYEAALTSASLSPPPPPPPPPPPSSTSLPHSSTTRKKDLPSLSPKKAQLAALGNAGQGFTPLVITIAAGEDVAQNIMLFIHQRKRAVCILSGSGSVSNASLCQSATLGRNVIYEGRFEILSLSGSFLHMETSGASRRTGGLNICLSGVDDHLVGGGVGGPLIAAGPVQVIVATFLIDPDINASTSSSMDNSGSKMSAPVMAGTTLNSPSSRSFQESSGRVTPSEGSDDHPSFGGSGSAYMFHSQGMHSQGMPMMPSRSPTDWRGRQDNEHGKACWSPDDEDEGNFRD